MSEFLPVGYKLSKEREHARSEQAFGFAGPSKPRPPGANCPPPNIFVGIKAKTFQTWNATFPPPLDFQTFLRPCFAR